MATMRLGEILVEEGFVDPDQIEVNLRRCREYGLRLGQSLVLERDLTEVQLAKALARAFELEYVDLEGFAVDAALIARVRLKNIQRLRVVPIRLQRGLRSEETLVVATANPENPMVFDELRAATGTTIRGAVATETSVAAMLRQIFGSDPTPPVHSLRMVDVALHQFARGTVPTLLLQAHHAPISLLPEAVAVGAPPLPQPLTVESLATHLELGLAHRWRQYRPLGTGDVEHVLAWAMTESHRVHCRQMGGVTFQLTIPIHGKFNITISNYQDPGDTQVGDRGPCTVRIDRVRLV